MFPRKLDNLNTLCNNDNEFVSEYEISDSGYGKDNVKLLHVERNGAVHSIKEFEVNTHLKLYSKKDYLNGDNSDIVATDSQKNTVYLLAKKFGVQSPEEFAIRLCTHFLTTYRHVEAAHVYIEEYPWKRINYSKDLHGPEHNHAFIYTPVATRYCDVLQKRHDKHPTIISGLKDLRVLKTTQSSFVNFINDEFRSLPDMEDRVFSTIITASWQYSDINKINFDSLWHHVKEIILQNFAGDYHVGIPSPSVQNTIYLAQRDVLKTIKEISSISIQMPNKHYFVFDTSKYPAVVQGENKEVFHPVDKPSGIIYSQLSRKNILSKL
jgi:urate oxidase